MAEPVGEGAGAGGRAGARVAMALVHYPVLRDRAGDVGATSVTPLNIHDLARAARTYGVAPFYVVTPLPSQQELLGRILGHWLDGYGGEANPTRREALRHVRVVSSVNEAADDLTELAGAAPRFVGTGARERPGSAGYAELGGLMREPGAPWLLLFGTGWGLAPQLVDSCDRLLGPVRGPGDWNHLSVRTAVAVVLDRLFGA